MQMADKIIMRPVEALIPYARNARTHSDAQVAQIAGSIREFGFTNPILLDGENGIIAGHGRVLAARKLGMVEVPCIELAHLTPAQRRAYVIADNCRKTQPLERAIRRRPLRSVGAARSRPAPPRPRVWTPARADFPVYQESSWPTRCRWLTRSSCASSRR